MITPVFPKYRKRRTHPKPKVSPPAPPSTDTLVVSVVAGPGKQALWTFDHDVDWDGITETTLKINGASPTIMVIVDATQLGTMYAVQPAAGDAWSIDTTPTHVTSPGRTIPAPQSGSVSA